MVVRREGLDTPKARAFEPMREHDMRIEPPLPQRDRGEAHADLEGDAGLLGDDDHRTVRACRRLERAVRLHYLPQGACGVRPPARSPPYATKRIDESTSKARSLRMR